MQSWAVRDSAKQIKPAGWELARLYAPVVLSIVKHEGRAELKAAAHNGGSVPRSLSLRAIDLTTGKVVAEGSDSLDTSSLDSTRVLLWGEAEGVEPVWRLLGEPKDLHLGDPAPIRARLEADAIVLETSLPVVDLWAHQSHCIGGWIDMVVTSPQAGQITLRGGSSSSRFSPDPDAPSVDEDDARVLRLRSLAGEHPIEWV